MADFGRKPREHDPGAPGATEGFSEQECRPQLVIGEVEKPLFRAVLTYTNGNQSEAAEILGINRGTLRKKLKDYKLQGR